MNYRGSILQRLEWGYALATLLVVGLMALFMDRALERSLDAEDAIVMKAQAASIRAQLNSGSMPSALESRPEKAEWQWLSADGSIQAFSEHWPSTINPPWEQVDARPFEWETSPARPFVLMRTSFNRGELRLAMDRTHELSLIRGFRQTLIIGGLGAVLLAALLGRGVARSGLRPLHQIAEETASIEARHLDQRLEASNFPRELNEVAESLNAMLARLESAFTRLERLGSELAHELRTPLQRLRLRAERLALNPEPPRPHELGQIVEACDDMGAHIEQMLFLARSEDPRAKLQRSDISVETLFTECVDFFEAFAQEAGIVLSKDVDSNLHLSADSRLLKRALHNLISNALRATPRGGSITLGATQDQGGLALLVRDTGAGIDPKLHARIAEPWVRGNDSSGAGLGLAIVRSIVHLHGGRIDFQSAASGGTQVVIWLP
jgi:two-component system, OmpR family, heavy metal sensor histidine kinase CusS